MRQRTQLINALRGHLTEHGFVVAKGIAHVGKLIEHLEDPKLPEQLRTILSLQVEMMKVLEDKIVRLDDVQWIGEDDGTRSLFN